MASRSTTLLAALATIGGTIIIRRWLLSRDHARNNPATSMAGESGKHTGTATGRKSEGELRDFDSSGRDGVMHMQIGLANTCLSKQQGVNAVTIPDMEDIVTSSDRQRPSSERQTSSSDRQTSSTDRQTASTDRQTEYAQKIQCQKVENLVNITEIKRQSSARSTRMTQADDADTVVEPLYVFEQVIMFIWMRVYTLLTAQGSHRQTMLTVVEPLYAFEQVMCVWMRVHTHTHTHTVCV